MANIVRFSPFENMIDEFRKGFWVKPFEFSDKADLQMKIEVKEDDKAICVKADIPGVKKEDIHVDIDDDRVSVRAESKQEKEEKKGEKVVYSERSYGMVSRTFSVPSPVDSAGAKAEYKDGVLTLVLPKKAGKSAKRLTVM